jgi:hypothetical protein
VKDEKKDDQDPNQKPKLRETGDFWYGYVDGTREFVVRVELTRGQYTDYGEKDLDRLMAGSKRHWIINQPTNVQKTTINGTPARTFDSASADGTFRHLLFIYNRRIIELQVPSTRVAKADQDKFLSSVKIEDPQLGRWQAATVAFGGVQLSADFPGKPLRATGDEILTERAWTVNFTSGARVVVNIRSDTTLPDMDIEGAVADKLIDDKRNANAKMEIYDVKRAEASGIEGREVKTRTAKESTHDRLWVMGGAAISARIFEPGKLKPADVQRFFNSIKLSRGTGAPPVEPKKK